MATASGQVAAPLNPAIGDPSRTITAGAGIRRRASVLEKSQAQRKLVGNPVVIAPVRFPSRVGAPGR